MRRVCPSIIYSQRLFQAVFEFSLRPIMMEREGMSKHCLNQCPCLVAEVEGPRQKCPTMAGSFKVMALKLNRWELESRFLK